jgi:hypothetical protein
MIMSIRKTEEAGYAQALHGLGLPHGSTSRVSPEEVARLLAAGPGGDTLGGKLARTSVRCAALGGGHESFLELIQTWWLVKAPLFYWRQMDRYRMKSQISESTMHTLRARPLTHDDFSHRLPECVLAAVNGALADDAVDIEELSAVLPNGYLQQRALCMNYRELASVLSQRRHHRLGAWRTFVEEAIKQVDHPELLAYTAWRENRESDAVMIADKMLAALGNIQPA